MSASLPTGTCARRRPVHGEEPLRLRWEPSAVPVAERREERARRAVEDLRVHLVLREGSAPHRRSRPADPCRTSTRARRALHIAARAELAAVARRALLAGAERAMTSSRLPGTLFVHPRSSPAADPSPRSSSRRCSPPRGRRMRPAVMRYLSSLYGPPFAAGRGTSMTVQQSSCFASALPISPEPQVPPPNFGLQSPDGADVLAARLARAVRVHETRLARLARLASARLDRRWRRRSARVAAARRGPPDVVVPLPLEDALFPPLDDAPGSSAGGAAASSPEEEQAIRPERPIARAVRARTMAREREGTRIPSFCHRRANGHLVFPHRQHHAARDEDRRIADVKPRRSPPRTAPRSTATIGSTYA